MTKRFLFTIIPFLLCCKSSLAQTESEAALFKTILEKDSLLFDCGFNTCNLEPFQNLLSDHFEFFHDKGGTSDKQKFIHDLKTGLCQSPQTYQSRRELVAESSEIYPLYQNNMLYGAVQKGNHRFYEKTEQSEEKYAGSARFTHLWLLENGTWKLAKSLSFDHQSNDRMNEAPGFFEKDKAIEKWLKDNRIPVLGIGIIRHGKLQRVNVYGELQNGVSVPYNTIFNVASLTKPITAMVALKLVSQGKWNLDEPVYRYWTDPEVADDKNHLTLTTRHILSHQSGFPNWRYEHPEGKLRFAFKPGTQYRYSGEGFEYLRKALEKKFRKSLQQLAAELIFEPLKMNDTSYYWNNKTDENRFATGYNSEGKPYPLFKHQTANAADDLLTTISDYSRFMVSLLDTGGLTDKVYQEMITPQVSVKKDLYFGLGLLKYDLGNGTYALSHSGADEGSKTIAFLLPESKEGLVIFTNADNGYLVYEKLLPHYLGENGKKIIKIESR